jgi:hypothetical protein
MKKFILIVLLSCSLALAAAPVKFTIAVKYAGESGYVDPVLQAAATDLRKAVSKHKLLTLVDGPADVTITVVSYNDATGSWAPWLQPVLRNTSSTAVGISVPVRITTTKHLIKVAFRAGTYTSSFKPATPANIVKDLAKWCTANQSELHK